MERLNSNDTHAEERAFVKFLSLVKDITKVIFEMLLVCHLMYYVVD
jgi:hypothetical protein